MSRSFNESKVRRDQNGRFKDQDKHHAPTDLPTSGSKDEPVGNEFIDNANTIAEGLFERKQDWDDLPIGGCYRINDFGDYVTEDDWDEVWDGHPLEEKAWMLADNGRYTGDDVAQMSPSEIEAAYDEGDIYTDTYDQHPTYAYYTEKDEEDDYDLSEPIGPTVTADIRQTGEQLAGQSRESMDFEPGEHVHATPNGFVGDAEWEQAWEGQPAYARAAYELSCRHPGLNMESLSPKQIITMNNSEDAYYRHIYGVESGKCGHKSDLALDRQTQDEATMYRQNERNARYVGRNLDNVISTREDKNDISESEGFTAISRLQTSPAPLADVDSLSTVAIHMDHTPCVAANNILSVVSGGSGVDDPPTETKPYAAACLDGPRHTDGEDRWSNMLHTIADNADDTHGAGCLATSLQAFADYRNGNKDQARRTAEQVREAAKHHNNDCVWRTADDVAAAILEH